MFRSGWQPFLSVGALVVALSAMSSPSWALGENTSEQKSRENDVYNEILTEQSYLALLKAADEETFRDQFESEILLLLDDELKQEYSQLRTLEDRKSFIIYFWKAQNPNPLLDQNDRLLDHLKRRAYARKNFPASDPPYVDDRGKYFIKYGKPFFRVEDFGGLRQINSLVTIPFKGYSVLPNETWSYVNVSPNFIVNFAKQGATYKEIKSLRDVVVSNRRRSLLVWYWSDLMKHRFWVSPLYNQAVSDIIDQENAILTMLARARFPSSRSFVIKENDMRLNTRRVEDALYSSLARTDSDTRQASLDVPVATYTPVHAKNKLPLSDAIAQFKGPQGKTRLEVFLFSPLSRYVKRSHGVFEDSVWVEFSCALQDSAFNALDEGRFERQFLTRYALAEKLSNTVGYLTVAVPPQKAKVFVQVRDRRKGKIGFYEKPIAIRNFESHDLMVSDLQFFAEVTSEQQKTVLPVVEKQGLLLTPYPFEKLIKSKPVYCYFEIYNLRSSGIRDEYQVTYRVYNDTHRSGLLNKLTKWISHGPQKSVSITQSQPVSEDWTQELIALDLSKLPGGDYRLEVTVADSKDPSIKASVSTDLKLED